MAEKKENERIFTIPLGKTYKRKSERKRSPYSIRLIRDYLKKHTKAKTVKFGQNLNSNVWERGIRRPVRKVRVKVIMDGDVLKAELVGFEYTDFKAAPKTEKKSAKEKLMERLGPKALQKEKEEKAVEGKEETEKKEEKEESIENTENK
ncbi:60S ribosomal protein L31 [archaeon]|nr:60S ribosomal protein L31 [archaeon]